MDHPDKKRAHSSASNSAPTPPSKRHQPMTHQAAMSSAQAADGRQSAVGTGLPTAMAAAPAASSAAPAVGALPMSASQTVSTASRPSPAQRCPSDPLSVVLSFLDARAFVVASRICRHWRRASDLQTAWPSFSVERLISGLVEDGANWTQSRSLRVSARRLGAGALEQMAQSTRWRRLTELQLKGISEYEPVELVPLNQVAQLPQLQSLHLDWVRVADVAAALGSMTPRLTALNCGYLENASAIQPHLPLLANLRVLAMAGTIGGETLLQLRRLEYLHLGCEMHRDLLLAIRRLSVQHRLRHLSLAPANSRTLDSTPLVAELDGADSGLAPAALISLRLHCNLSGASPSALLSLPSLTRLDWKGHAGVMEGLPAHQQSASPPSPLQQLRLDFEFDSGGMMRLLQQAAIRAPQLRELHLNRPPPSFDQLVPLMRSLRLLDITGSNSSPLSLPLLQSLSALPLFTQLVLRNDSWRPTTFELSLESLRCIAESAGWRLIRLTSSNHRQITAPSGVDAQLAGRLADFRVHSQSLFGTVVCRLVASADGAVEWKQTTI